MAELKCWRCGTELAELSLPLSRRDECPGCSVELHVCRMCEHYAADVPRQCREDDAEEIKEKDRANFCDWFIPAADAYTGKEAAAEEAARAELDNLFGGESAPENTPESEDGPGDDAFRAADDLFK